MELVPLRSLSKVELTATISGKNDFPNKNLATATDFYMANADTRVKNIDFWVVFINHTKCNRLKPLNERNSFHLLSYCLAYRSFSLRSYGIELDHCPQLKQIGGCTEEAREKS